MKHEWHSEQSAIEFRKIPTLFRLDKRQGLLETVFKAENRIVKVVKMSMISPKVSLEEHPE